MSFHWLPSSRMNEEKSDSEDLRDFISVTSRYLGVTFLLNYSLSNNIDNHI